MFLAPGLVPVLHASEGNAGACGCIAVVALAGLSSAESRPLSLALNVLVASVGVLLVHLAIHSRADVFITLEFASVQVDLMGGAFLRPAPLLQRLLDVVVLVAPAKLMGILG